MIPELTAAPVIASAAVEGEDDAALVGRLQSGDATAFVEEPFVATSRGCCAWRSRPSAAGAVGEEVTQDTWLAVFRGVDRFEGRSSFKTWLFRILLNRARSAARREERAGRPDDALADERFDANGAWSDRPSRGPIEPKTGSSPPSSPEPCAYLLPQIPEAQRQVVVLCDMEGVPPADVVAMLGLTEGNRRVLLHRGRARLRALLAQEMTRSWAPLVASPVRSCVASGRVDDRLSRRAPQPGERDRLERHLADCPHCSEYLAQLRVTVDASGRAAPTS